MRRSKLPFYYFTSVFLFTHSFSWFCMHSVQIYISAKIALIFPCDCISPSCSHQSCGNLVLNWNCNSLLHWVLTQLCSRGGSQACFYYLFLASFLFIFQSFPNTKYPLMRAATAVSGLWISCVCWCAGPGSEQSKHKLEKFDNVIWGKVGPLMFYLVRHSPCLPPAALRSISNVFRPNTILCTSARNLYTRKNEMQLRPFSANDMTGCRFPGLNTDCGTQF